MRARRRSVLQAVREQAHRAPESLEPCAAEGFTVPQLRVLPCQWQQRAGELGARARDALAVGDGPFVGRAAAGPRSQRALECLPALAKLIARLGATAARAPGQQ